MRAIRRARLELEFQRGYDAGHADGYADGRRDARHDDTLTDIDQIVLDAADEYERRSATDVIRSDDPRPTLREMLTKGKWINDARDALLDAVRTRRETCS